MIFFEEADLSDQQVVPHPLSGDLLRFRLAPPSTLISSFDPLTGHVLFLDLKPTDTDTRERHQPQFRRTDR